MKSIGSRASQGATCSSSTPCDNTLLLTCSSGQCSCSSSYYWNGATCS